jgi:hypothetical protein
MIFVKETSILSVITVGSSAALTDALSLAQGGDTILLEAGTYSGLHLSGLSFSSAVTITSADPAHQATLTNFNMSNVNGLTFRGLEMSAQAPSSPAYNIYTSQNITLDHVSVHGSLDGNPQNDVFGISFFDSKSITVTNSEFQQLSSGVGFTRSSNIVLSGNDIHDMRSDGVDLSQVDHVSITGNVIHDIFPEAGDHPDAIQFMTAGTTVASHDIDVSGNLIYRGAGAYTQGIFMNDEVGTLPVQTTTISDNTIVGTGWSGIRPIHNTGLIITGNQLVSLTGDQPTTLLVQFSDHVTASNNTGSSISFSDTTINLTESGDNGAAATTANGGAAIQQWLATHS